MPAAVLAFRRFVAFAGVLASVAAPIPSVARAALLAVGALAMFAPSRNGVRTP